MPSKSELSAGPPGSWRRRAVADDGNSRARDTLLVEAAVGQPGWSDAEHGLVEKTEADVADSWLGLSVGVVERAALRGARPRERRMSDARAAATEVDPCALSESIRSEADNDSKPGRKRSKALGSSREMSRCENGLRMNQDGRQTGGESTGEAERVVRVAPHYDRPDIRIGVHLIDSFCRYKRAWWDE